MEQSFLAAHPWTDTAKPFGCAPGKSCKREKRDWSVAEYVSRNEMRKSAENRTQYRVCEMEQTLLDEQEQKTYCLRWCSVGRAARLSRMPNTVSGLGRGGTGLQRIARLLGRYDYTHRSLIQSRMTRP